MAKRKILDLDALPKTCVEAKTAGSRHFFDGILCENVYCEPTGATDIQLLEDL